VPNGTRISEDQLEILREQLLPLVGVQFTILSLPDHALIAFEPSQIGTIVGTLMDACLPHLPEIPRVGLSKHEGILRDREGYPDYKHTSGFRLELKLLYINNSDLAMKRPRTPREPSARLTQKVTIKNVRPDKDAMLLIAYQLRPQAGKPGFISPTIVDLAVLSMIELVEARDRRMAEAAGRWFGNYETPTIPSKIGRRKIQQGQPLDLSAYGRKESEGKDFNEDTNFGKLQRIPHPGLQAFLQRYQDITPGEEEVAPPE
jgi:hypothetical protein